MTGCLCALLLLLLLLSRMSFLVHPAFFHVELPAANFVPQGYESITGP